MGRVLQQSVKVSLFPFPVLKSLPIICLCSLLYRLDTRMTILGLIVHKKGFPASSSEPPERAYTDVSTMLSMG